MRANPVTLKQLNLSSHWWLKLQIPPGYLLVMLTSALDNCSSVTESGTEKETLDSGKINTMWGQKVKKTKKHWHYNDTLESFLIRGRLLQSPETVVRGRSHSIRRQEEWRPGLNISALWSHSSKSVKIRQQRFYVTTTSWFRNLTDVKMCQGDGKGWEGRVAVRGVEAEQLQMDAVFWRRKLSRNHLEEACCRFNVHGQKRKVVFEGITMFSS